MYRSKPASIVTSQPVRLNLTGHYCVSVIYKEDGALLRFSLFVLGAFLYGGGIFQLFGMKE